jgi:hypothetical protein
LTSAARPTHASLMNDHTNKGEGELGVLARRKIEAAIVAPIYDEMRQAIGEEKARDILRRAIRRAAIDAGAEMATRAEGGADLESFKAILPLWTKDDALTIEVIDDAPGVLDFNVKRCRYAETYRAMGLGDIGDILSCNRDGVLRGLRSAHQADTDPDDHGRREPLRFPLSRESRVFNALTWRVSQASTSITSVEAPSVGRADTGNCSV